QVFEPVVAVLTPIIGRGRDPIQAYCDVLEEKWILSELARTDIGLGAAIDAYIGLGAPSPESDVGSARVGLDIDWSGGWEIGLDDETADETG
ncbi:MAG TPA: DUF4032 domain-containing protein, partial [Candidatus Limnocylindrales bacterium]